MDAAADVGWTRDDVSLSRQTGAETLHATRSRHSCRIAAEVIAYNQLCIGCKFGEVSGPAGPSSGRMYHGEGRNYAPSAAGSTSQSRPNDFRTQSTECKRTAAPIRGTGVAASDRVYYVPPTGSRCIGRSHGEVDSDDVFIDLGSGKGRMVLAAAARYPFKRVIGVELAEQLHEVARANVAEWSPAVALVRTRATLFDVLDYEILTT